MRRSPSSRPTSAPSSPWRRGFAPTAFRPRSCSRYSIEEGLALIEDFGAETVVEDGVPNVARYAEAIALLVDLHGRDLPDALPAGEDLYRLPTYDIEAMLVEVELALDWYAPAIARVAVPSGARMQFLAHWRELLSPILAQRTTWTLRDYHSPNLHWLAEREGFARIGLIDFQDAVIGPPAYDLASLLQDARIDVSDDLEMRLAALYVRRRGAADPDFDAGRFAAAYAAMGAQRATKILGLFARLDKRDGKPQYLAPPAPDRALSHEEPCASVAPAARALVSDPSCAGAGSAAGGTAGAAGPSKRSTMSAPVPKTAMVFAAGLGARMRPITDMLPKPLVKVGGRTLIDHCLDRLAEDGVERAVVNVHWHADQIEAHLAPRRSPRILISDERAALLDQGGGIKRALPLLGKEPFLLCNTDAFWIEGPRSNIARLAARVRCRNRWTSRFWLRPPRGRSASTGPATSP